MPPGSDPFDPAQLLKIGTEYYWVQPNDGDEDGDNLDLFTDTSLDEWNGTTDFKDNPTVDPEEYVNAGNATNEWTSGNPNYYNLKDERDHTDTDGLLPDNFDMPDLSSMNSGILLLLLVIFGIAVIR